MDNEAQLSPTVIYELVAAAGFRKYFHLGGPAATENLIALCHVDASDHILDVGCASGKTACHIARQRGCRVVGVDLLEGMVRRANERAQREMAEDRVRFLAADAQDLPFEDECFDVVLGEFITGLLDDKRRAASGYLRVTRPGGYIGLNEATWIRTPPPPGLTEYLSHTLGVRGEILTPDDWTALLTDVGLRDVTASVHQVESLSNRRDDLLDVLRTWPRILYLYVTSAAFRKFLKEGLSLPSELLDYFGYGIYIGRK